MRRSLPGLYLCIGALAAAVAASTGSSTSGAVLLTMTVLAVGAVGLGVTVHRPPQPAPWLLLGGAVAAWAIWAVATVAAGSTPGSPSTLVSLSQIPAYVFLTAAAVTLIRGSGRVPIAAVDAGIVLAALATVLWPVAFEPTLDKGGMDHVVAAGIVAVDLVVATLLLRVAFAATGRVRSFQLIFGAVALMTAGDALNISATHTTTVNHVLYACYVLEAALIGAAAVHPSMRLLPLHAPPSSEPSPRRSILVISTALVAPGAAQLLNHWVAHDHHAVPFVCADIVLAGVVIARVLRVLQRADELRRHAEASEQKFRMVFDHAGIGISIGSNGMLTETNEAYQRMLGYTADEMSRMHYTEVTHPDDIGIDEVEAALVAAGEKQSFTVEKRYLRRDGETRWVSVTVTMAPDRSFGIGMIEDITDRRRLLQRTVEVAEDERMALAADLHDGPIQRLTAASLSLDLLGNKLRRKGESEEAELAQRIRAEVAAEMTALRQMMAGLRPPVIDERGLDAALRDCAQTVLARVPTLFTLESNLDGRRLAPEVETAIYRLVREALTNVRKHARASRVSVRIDARDSGVGLEIDDDGSGFDPRADPNGHLGLLSMRERVESHGGTWSLVASPGGGTRISAKLPANAEVGRHDRDRETVEDTRRRSAVYR
jgi:PAS domain S-box-containing protein